MNEYAEILNFVKLNSNFFKVLPIQSPYHEGVIEGLDMVRKYLEMRMNDIDDSQEKEQEGQCPACTIK